MKKILDIANFLKFPVLLIAGLVILGKLATPASQLMTGVSFYTFFGGVIAFAIVAIITHNYLCEKKII